VNAFEAINQVLAEIFRQYGSAWLLSLAFASLLVFLLRFWSRSGALSEAVQQDWTVLSFMLYGGTVVSTLLDFEEYRYDDAWKIAAWVFGSGNMALPKK